MLVRCFLALVAAFAVFALGTAGMARAQPEPTMVISPSSGPCDATVEVRGQDFPPSTAIRLDIIVPQGDGSMGKLASLTTDPSGRFVTKVNLGSLGCRAAALDDDGQLGISADLEERVIEPGQGMPPILTRTAYTYTTTQVGPEPTMVISPPSGPCDATVEVTGQDFPPSTAIRLDMGAPQSDGMMGKLASLITDPSGRFVTKVNLGSLGCRAAALDDPDLGQLWLFADLEEPVIEPQGVPSSLARAPYRYTTTHVASEPPPDTLPGTGSPPDPRPMPLARLALAGLLAGLGIVLLLAPLCARRLRS